jgi:hypothetical protein
MDDERITDMDRISAYWTWLVTKTGSTKSAAAITVGMVLLLVILMAAVIS